MKTPPPGGYFEWDGKDEDERPATPAELRAGVEAYRRLRGLNKARVAICFDADVLSGLRATGKDWRTRVNDAMREWLKSHPA